MSGDLHGAELVKAIKARTPAYQFLGRGGDHLSSLGSFTNWVERAAVVGVTEVLKNYPYFKEQFRQTLAEIEEAKPKAIIFVDYPGFNLRIAKEVKKRHPEITLIYYISPQVWAWNRGRIPKMAKFLDLMMCLFPFEKPLYEGSGLNTAWVGHPLVDEMEERRLEVEHDSRLVALFPGSRMREVSSLFPPMLDTVTELHARNPSWRFEAAPANPKLRQAMEQMLSEKGLGDVVLLSEKPSHELMQRARQGIVASGTATLEAAYYGMPYCLVYKVSPLTYLLGKMLVKIQFLGIVNILAEKEVVKEFIQHEAEAPALVAEMLRLLEDEEAYESLKKELLEASKLLGGAGAPQRAADEVLKSLAES